ncbi:hypothetical protein P175DRAFT_0502484 [Aspergillus ochraceoroseus IBT 24754]|uniref:Uncharacterized protein n=3 Tax=Aspergillus subgen. Nidulantes TaxID=2720870 RepID=A0A2T5LVP3_9EURO|nr:uncharacterized protein P175DRAFT_0502484 [Aspergillus ochraceoroseus IBT 24754]KKK18104.1 hypothetical protein AOCH_003557 [Aspergillus ochraceoroseus]PTU20348.1 hypothetical protein P175DRAFT_0502484 [Aspergillus ochraceoroseus IBT 24754]
MRVSHRIGAAALLIILIFLIKRHLDSTTDAPRPKTLWNYNVGSKSDNSEFDLWKSKWSASEAGVSRQEYETTPIVVPNDRVIVMARLSTEDTNWVSADLADWRNYIYTVDDVNARKHTPKNKGRESLAYLQYIVEHYDDLPSTIVFLHSHKDGWPAAWHTDTMDYSNVESIRALQTDFIQQNGYANLRCQETPGCPDEIRPFRDPPRPGKTVEKIYAQAWQELFHNTNVPEVIGVPCCSQFAVSRDQVLKRPLSDYQRFYNWVLNNDLPDDMTSRVMEYTWHIIFGQDPVYCPDVFQCYQDVYGNPYFW